MVTIECRDHGGKDITALINYVFDQLPTYWLDYLTLTALRVVICEKPLKEVAEIAEEIAEFGAKYSEFYAKYPQLEGAKDDDVYVTKKSPHTIYFHRGNMDEIEIMEALLNACGEILLTNPTFRSIIAAAAFGPPDQNVIELGMITCFGKFFLHLEPASRTQEVALERMRHIDFLLHPHAFHMLQAGNAKAC